MRDGQLNPDEQKADKLVTINIEGWVEVPDSDKDNFLSELKSLVDKWAINSFWTAR